MTSKLMLGSAFAAMLVATPALAQMSEFRECAIEEWTEEEFLGITVEEPGLTMEEYRDCLEEAGIRLDQQQMDEYETTFMEADANRDAVLVWAEVEAYQQDRQAAATGDDEEDGPEGTVTVTQPAADVVVEQPAPEVEVEQAQPDVDVTTPEPDVDVATRQPEVEVTQPEPDVDVEQDQPAVMVEQPEPQVAIDQPQPDVEVEPGQPAVEVETARPEVEVEQPEPEVAVEQPEFDVEVERGQPDVAVRQAQPPDVEVEQTAQADVETEAEAEAEVVATETDAMAEEMRIAVTDLEGRDVLNSAGEEVGEIEAILLDPNANAPVVIISVGGVFGIGAREVAFPYEDFAVSGDTVVLDTDMSQDEISDMPEYDETAYQELPESMRVE